MTDKNIIQKYINNFRRFFSSYLKPGIGMKCIIYPAKQKGAILEFHLGPGEENNDIYSAPEVNINEALKKIDQKAFGGNLSGFNFGGTNIILEPNRIILIRAEEGTKEWSEPKAQEEVKKILNSRHKARTK